jgi:hypothetical protein
VWAHLASSGKEAHFLFQVRVKRGMGRVSAPPKVSVQADDSSAVSPDEEQICEPVRSVGSTRADAAHPVVGSWRRRGG